MRRLIPATVLCLPFLLLASQLHAQAATSASKVVGRVTDQDNGRPINGAAVLVEGEGRAVTDANGWFVLEAVAAGAREIRVEMIGYASRTDTVRLNAGRTHELAITLAREPISLKPVEVSVRSAWLEARGFYEREQSGTGTHITREDIERRRPRQMTDLLRDVPGVRIHHIEVGRLHVRLSRGNAGQTLAFDPRAGNVLSGCEPDLYIDGQLFRERITSDPQQNRLDNWDVIDPTLIEGIEVYGGQQAPLQYKSPCGVVLVWTRRTAPQVVVRNDEPREAPSITTGMLARVTSRFTGERSSGLVQTVNGDSISIFDDGQLHAFAISDLRTLEADAGIAPLGQRMFRGARWGFMLSVATIAIAAAAEEFSRSNGQLIGVSKRSPRDPAFAMTIIGAGTATGALLGSAIWKYRRWQEVPIR